ncbi:zinc finger protein xfin [Lasius niger]|uniref:Zinc finger protein xfin n=1 Tax=Lasius niger TaxID=67767 RepID=A0A0J7L307_LASNI|nr:zinc finger protein xfin [Lasius niger]
MAMPTERRKSYHDLCRLCASHDNASMHIFGEEGISRQLVGKIQTCLPFKIEEDDRLPKVLCYRCMYNLENFYDFRTACVNAAAWLERNRPKEGASDDSANDSAQCSEMHAELLKGKENMPILIPEAPVVNPNAALGTPPRLNSDGEADPEIEEILDASEGTDEVLDDSTEDRRSEYEYEMDMETNPSDFLEMTPMVTEENEEECVANNTSVPTGGQQQDAAAVFPPTSQQHEVYVCSLCNKAFSSKGHLSLHARIHVGEGDVIGERVITDDHTSYQRPYQCDLCHKSYSTAKHRWGHVSTTHRGHPAVTCAYCSRIYSTRYNLEEHIKSRHAGLPPPPELSVSLSRAETRYQCQTCPMVYKDLADFNAHRQICEEQRTDLLGQTDAQNNKSLVDVSDMSSIIDSDDENKDFRSAEAKLAKNPQLTILKQALTKGDSLKRNYDDDGSTSSCKTRKMVKIEGENPEIKRWYCEYCPQSFTSVDGLKLHEVRHDAEKPFICILCKKDFVLKSSLIRHITTIHGVDPTPIIDSDKCLKTSVMPQNWNRMDVSVYEQSEIKEPPEFSSSPEVNLDNDDKDSKNNHENIEIETVFICEICTRDFNDRASLWLHMRATHKELAAFACGVCLKICSDNTQLQSHLYMYHGKSKLLISEQRSNYYNENLNGTEGNEQVMDFDGEDGEKVDCYICYKSFPNEDHLIRHQRNAHKSEQIIPLGDAAGSGNAANVNGNGNRAQYHLFFVCEICGSSHSSKWERWLHINNMHSNESSIKHHLIQGPSPNTCEICGKLWPTRVDYWKHVMGVHADMVPLICGVCLKVFSDVVQLSAHVKAKHWPLTSGDFSCDICGRPYSNKSKMSRHRKIHGLEVAAAAAVAADVACDNSNLNETTNESIKLEHGNNRAVDVKLKCEQCPEHKFTTLDSLRNHRRVVHNLFPCDLCVKYYGRTSHLWKHVNRVHKGHPDVTCPYCAKTSASRDHLAAHIAKIHRYVPAMSGKDSQNCVVSKSLSVEDGVLHYCEKCNKGFHKRYLLRRHMKGCQNYRKDPGALLTRCRACERIFKDRASLQKHIENHHSTYTCHLCNETITSKLGIMTHNRVNHMDHPDLTCDNPSCKKLFRTKEDLESHRKDHKYHSNPNVCDFCGDTVENKLKLKMHVLSLHRNEIGVSCGVCLIPMKDPKDLKKHVEAEHSSVLSNPNTCQVCGKQYASKWKAFDHTKKCHGKVFLTCKQCLAVFTNENDIRDHYEHVHNVPKDQLAVFEYRMDIGAKREDYETPDIIVKEEPDDLEFDEEMCDESSNDSRKRRRSPNDTYDCEMCPEIFLNSDTLAKHYQNVHNTDPVRMFKKFKKSNGDGKRKMRNRNNYECKNCKKHFSTKTLFWNHINACTRRNSVCRFDAPNNIPTSILESHLKNNNQIQREEPMPLTNESNLNIPDFNLFEDINLQLSAQKPVPNLMPLPQKSTGNGKCSRKDSRKVYDESTNTECTCEVCGKQWPAKKHLWQHLIRFHRAEAAVTCGVCLKLCKSYQDLADHLKAEHAPVLSPEGNNFTCKTCGRYHNARSKLLLHMSIHIGYFRCEKCQQGFASEEKLGEHATSCNGKSEFEDHAVTADIEDNAKNDNDEKGSLIADETSVIEEEVEEADFESEGEGSRSIQNEENNSEEDNSDSDDSDSGSNSSSSENEGEEDEEEEEEEQEEEEEENENESDTRTEPDTRTTSRASGDSGSCNSESDESDMDEAGVRTMQKKAPRLDDIDRFRIHDEENSSAMEKYEDQRTASVIATTDADQNKQSNLNNLLIPGAPTNVDKFKALRLQESTAATASDVDFSNDNENDNEEDDEEENNENDEEEEGDEGEGEGDGDGEGEGDEGEGEGEDENENENENEDEDESEDEGTSEAEAESGEDDGENDAEDGREEEEEEEEEEEGEENDEDDDDGPPVLSPIMPLLPENESEEHSNTMDRTRHKLSPMISLNMDKLMEGCEITEIKPDAENTAAPSNESNFFAANNNDLPVTWDEDDERDCDSDAGDGDVMVVKNEEYAKGNMNDLEGDDYEEDSADENVMDDRDGGSGDQVHEIHSLDGTVLMMTNDAEGNPILIQHNMLGIDNEDSNAEVAQYIYPENTYEIEEEEGEDENDFATRNETDATQTGEIQDISYVQDMSENEDSTTEDDVEENSSDAQK